MAHLDIIYVNFTLVDPASAAAAQANKEEVDARSVFVGNVSTHPVPNYF